MSDARDQRRRRRVSIPKVADLMYVSISTSEEKMMKYLVMVSIMGVDVYLMMVIANHWSNCQHGSHLNYSRCFESQAISAIIRQNVEMHRHCCEVIISVLSRN